MGHLKRVKTLPSSPAEGRREAKGARSQRTASKAVLPTSGRGRRPSKDEGDMPRPGEPRLLLRISTAIAGSTTFLALSLSFPTTAMRIRAITPVLRICGLSGPH